MKIVRRIVLAGAVVASMVPIVGLQSAGAAARAPSPGRDGADTLTGTNLADVICGLGGNDTIIGKQGDDTILGGKGPRRHPRWPGRRHPQGRQGGGHAPR